MTTHQPIFETERLIIHRYKKTDFENYFSLSSDEDVMRYIRPVQNRKEAEKFFREKVLLFYKKHPGLGRWAMIEKTTGRFAGSFAVIPVEHSDKIQLGYSLPKENWGKGYATESTAGGLRYVFEKLKLEEIAGITFPENIASQKVLLKNGFIFDSVFMEEDKELNLYLLQRSDFLLRQHSSK